MDELSLKIAGGFLAVIVLQALLAYHLGKMDQKLDQLLDVLTEEDEEAGEGE